MLSPPPAHIYAHTAKEDGFVRRRFGSRERERGERDRLSAAARDSLSRALEEGGGGKVSRMRHATALCLWWREEEE